MEALLQQYKDQLCDLKYKNSCLALEVDTLNIELKELHERATNELSRKEKVIIELEQFIQKNAMNNQAELKRLVREKSEAMRMQGGSEEEIQKLRNDNKRFVAELLEQLAQALGIKHTKELPHLLVRTKQLRMEYEQVIGDNQKLTMKLAELQATSRQLEATKSRLELRCKEKDEELSLLKIRVQQSQLNQSESIFKLKEELVQAKDQTDIIRRSGQALHVQCQHLRSQLQEERARYQNDRKQQSIKIEEVESQATELRDQMQSLRNNNRETEIEEEFSSLLDRIRVRKETKIKNMLSEKYRRFDLNGRTGIGSGLGSGQRDNSSMFDY